MAAESRVSRRSPIAISVEEAADLIGVGRTAAYEMAQRGELPCYRVVGRSWSCSRRQVEELFEARCAEAMRREIPPAAGAAD